MKANELIEKVNWEKVDGLVPTIVQDALSGKVLMLGYQNQAAISETIDTNQVTFFSRTKNRLWRKGETSGNVLELIDISLDCDNDTLLIQANPQGPTCHTGSETCFADHEDASVLFLQKLEKTIRNRKNNPSEKSYTSQLFAKGINKITQKVGEEGVETVIAGINEDDQALISESADLVYHLLVLLAQRDISINQVMSELQSRSH